MEKRTMIELANIANRYKNKMINFLEKNRKTIESLDKVPTISNNLNTPFSKEDIFNVFYIGNYKYFIEWVDIIKINNKVESLYLKFNFEVEDIDVSIYFNTNDNVNDIISNIKIAIKSKINKYSKFINSGEGIIYSN